MTLSEIATISGKGGLYKVLAPTKSGVILESLDEAKTKLVATSNHKLSLLNEISIYTTTKEGTAALNDVLKKIHQEYGNDPGVDGNSDSAELKSFLKSILPEFDESRVYTSDIKKLVKWYEILSKYAPEVITESEVKEPAKSEALPETADDEKAASEKKPQAKREKKEKSKKADKD
jgi:hypothetical protein